MSEIRFDTPGLGAADLRQLRSERSPVTSPKLPQEGSGFADLLKEMSTKINETQAVADADVKAMMAGENKSIHDVMISLEKADVALKMGMQVRNKIVEAYREIMRMQV